MDCDDFLSKYSNFILFAYFHPASAQSEYEENVPTAKLKKKKNSVIVRRINHLINHFNQYLLGLSSQVKLNMFNSIKKSYHEKDKLKEIILIQIFLLLRIFNISLKKKKKKYV